MENLNKIATIYKFYIEKKEIDITSLLKIEEFNKFLSMKVNENVLKDLKSKYQEKPITIYDLIEYSILIFDNEIRKNNGIAFTPRNIAEKMVDMTLENLSKEECKNIKVVDPAMGSGIFLIIIMNEIHKITGKNFDEIIEENIFGIDILEENVIFVRLLLSIHSLENNNAIPKRMNIIRYDSLEVNSEVLLEKFGIKKFDIVICNPPYVRSKNLSKDTKEKIKKFDTTYGISDIYISFFEIGSKMLENKGKGIYITPNSFLKSMNGKKLREFLGKNSSEIFIINFDNKSIFKTIQHYFCITVFKKEIYKNNETVYKYLKTDYEEDNKLWQVFSGENEWRTIGVEDNKIIENLEKKFGKSIGDLKFQNGIATQRNKIYSFDIQVEDDLYYYFYDINNNNVKVERDITRPFILPNTQIEYNNLRIIFPYKYDAQKQKYISISEEEFKDKYPYAYEYLEKYREDLINRKHDKSMPNWFSYGRSQGINQSGKRLYLPYLADKVNTKISRFDNEVFAAGYAIFDDSEEYLVKLSKIIESNIFSYYLKKISKPYSNNYYSTAKNMIKNFSIPSKDELKNVEVEEMNENYIGRLYGLTNEQIKLINSTLYQKNIK